MWIKGMVTRDIDIYIYKVIKENKISCVWSFQTQLWLQYLPKQAMAYNKKLCFIGFKYYNV